MLRVKRRIFSGAVCEQEVFSVSERIKLEKAEPRPRFKNEEEREAHKIGISRRKFVRIVNENFSPSSLYSTLTFDDEDEIHTFKEARKIADRFVRRLQYHAPDARIVLVKGRGKHTDRIHFHMISEGVTEKLIRDQWIYGTVVRIVNLREHNYYDGVDHGRDYTGLAEYLFNHWTPEQGGRRWKATRNLKGPEKEEPTIVKREYTEKRPPRAPKGYILVESKVTPYGYLYYKYVLEPPPKERQEKGRSPGRQSKAL